MEPRKDLNQANAATKNLLEFLPNDEPVKIFHLILTFYLRSKMEPRKDLKQANAATKSWLFSKSVQNSIEGGSRLAEAEEVFQYLHELHLKEKASTL